jgi:hypothetical protein
MPTFALAQPQKNQCSRTPELFYGRHYVAFLKSAPAVNPPPAENPKPKEGGNGK